MRSMKRALCLALAVMLMLCAALAEDVAQEQAAQAQSQPAAESQQPRSEAPAEAPAQQSQGDTPAEAPAQQNQGDTPAEAPAQEGQGETPAEVPAQEGQGETPAEVPAQENQGETPAEVPAQEGQGETPAEVPAQEGQGDAPAEVPAQEGQGDTPAEVPAQEGQGDAPAEVPAQEGQGDMSVETPAEDGQGEVPAEGLPEEPVAEPEQPPAGEGETPESALAVRLTSPEGLSQSGGVYFIDIRRYGSITLEWSCGAPCDGYSVNVAGPDGGEVYGAVQQEACLTLSLSGLAAGRYTVSVAALLEEASVAQGKLSFELAEGGPGGFPGGFPGGGFPSGFRGGSRGSFGGQGAEVEQGFRVTPGEALTSSHDSGSKDMSPYGSVALSAAEDAMTALTLGGETLQITLDGGAGTFTAALDGATLALTPESGGDAWVLNGYALRTLARSGVDTLLLTLEGETTALPIQPQLTGRVYGGLCAAGYVSSDYEYRVSAGGVLVSVDGESYRLNDAGELEPV